MSNLMPAIFVGHGNPMNVITDNPFADAWKVLGKNLPRPKTILCISAHWYVDETAVTAMPDPKIIYDFFGFPKDLYEVQYPAVGDPQLANRVKELLKPVSVRLDDEWGLDHGAWSVLYHLFPEADIPVVQLSINKDEPALFHYEIAKKLLPLREEGVLIIGSGNLVHNLRKYMWDDETASYDWAERFEQNVRDLILTRDHEPLINYASISNDAKLAIPTPDHYLPLLYIIALQQEGEKITFPVEGTQGGSISMLSVQIGG